MNNKGANWELLSGVLADQSKKWWGVAVVCQVLVVAISLLVALTSISPQFAVLLASGLTIGYTLLQWRSDRLKRAADSVKRKFELYDGLGWSISSKELSDLLAGVSQETRSKVRQ